MTSNGNSSNVSNTRAPLFTRKNGFLRLLVIVVLFIVAHRINGEIKDRHDEALKLPGSTIPERINALFKLIDVDDNKRLTRVEIEEWVQRTKVEQVGEKRNKQRDIQSESKILDSDSRISLNEFLALAKNNDLYYDVDSLRHLFEFADADKDGFVHENELELLLKPTKETVNLDSDGFVHENELELLLKPTKETEHDIDEYSNEAYELIKAHDLDQDGKITFEEYLEAAVKDIRENEINETEENKKPIREKLTLEELESLREEFDDVDQNRDGVVDIEEMKAVLKEDDFIPEDLSPEKIKAVADSILSKMNITNHSMNHNVSYDDLVLNLTKLASLFLTGNGEPFSKKYAGLDSLSVNETPIDGATATKTNRVEL